MHRSTRVRDFSLAAARALRPAVSFDGVCMLTIDPATLLPTSEVVEHGLPPATIPRMTEIEVAEVDFNKFADLASASRPAASLSEATEGNLDRSLRQRELRGPNGLGDELRAALSSIPVRGAGSRCCARPDVPSRPPRRTSSRPCRAISRRGYGVPCC